MANKNPYELLKTKEIYAILDGDTKYENYEFRILARESSVIQLPR